MAFGEKKKIQSLFNHRSTYTEVSPLFVLLTFLSLGCSAPLNIPRRLFRKARKDFFLIHSTPHVHTRPSDIVPRSSCISLQRETFIHRQSGPEDYPYVKCTMMKGRKYIRGSNGKSAGPSVRMIETLAHREAIVWLRNRVVFVSPSLPSRGRERGSETLRFHHPSRRSL